MKTNRPIPPLLNWWVIWIALLSGLPMFFIFLGTSAPGNDRSSLSLFVPLVATALSISVVLRWVVIPRLENPQIALQMFIMGMATAEAICFFGIFLAPAYKTLAFVLSFLGILQFIPLFAGKFCQPPKP
ncbi:MAG: hypothetical protein AB1705_18655 [Verrucomicrobiota bacterium]